MNNKCLILTILLCICSCAPQQAHKTDDTVRPTDSDLGILNVVCENITQSSALVKWETVEPIICSITWHTYPSDMFLKETERAPSRYHQQLIRVYKERQTVIFVISMAKNGVEYVGDGHSFDTLPCPECGNILEPPLWTGEQHE